MMLVAFLDTCISLHYPPLKDVDWLETCGAKAVTILLCNPVAVELDEKKSDALFSDRARKRIKEIEDNIKKEIRPNVWIDYFFDDELAKRWAKEDSPPPNDERIAQCILAHRSKHGEDVAVLTEDLGMKLRCRTHGIRVFAPASQLRLDNPASEEQQKIRKLEQQIRDITFKQPDLRLGLDQSSIEVKRPKLWDIEEQLANAKAAIFRTGRLSVGLRSSAAKLDEFLARVREWIEYQNSVADESLRTILLKLTLRNAGRAPAKHVNISIGFPEGIIAIWQYNSLWGSRLQKREPPSSSMFPLTFPMIEPVPKDLWRLYPHSADTFSLQDRKLLGKWELIAHGDEVVIPPVYITFGDWASIQRCALKVHIRTLEPPDDHGFDIPVELTVTETL